MTKNRKVKLHRLYQSVIILYQVQYLSDKEYFGILSIFCKEKFINIIIDLLVSILVISN